MEWSLFLFYLSHMQFRVPHIYREGNGFTDKLATFGTSITDTDWWDSVPDICLPFYAFGPSALRAC